MKMSRRALRMQRNHKRNAAKAPLNLTALMDIFTILVFFLMVNQSDVDIPRSESIELPVAMIENTPEEHLTVIISRHELLVQGRLIARNEQLTIDDDDAIAELTQELNYLASRAPMSDAQGKQGRYIIIMADKNTPYRLLKQVMNTCAATGYSNISLAINQKADAGGAG